MNLVVREGPALGGMRPPHIATCSRSAPAEPGAETIGAARFFQAVLTGRDSGCRCVVPQLRNLPVAVLLYVRWDRDTQEDPMNGLIYLVGLVVVILAVLSFFGLR